MNTCLFSLGKRTQQLFTILLGRDPFLLVAVLDLDIQTMFFRQGKESSQITMVFVSMKYTNDIARGADEDDVVIFVSDINIQYPSSLYLIDVQPA